MRRHDPEGREYPPTAYVFGNAAGERVGAYKRAWTTTRRAAGIRGLQVRDLRREGASSLLEGRVPEHAVQAILGHADLSTTSTYLATTRQGLHDQMRRFEAVREARERDDRDKDAREDAQVVRLVNKAP
jgi:integrase